jgi:hypothetical protein
MDNYDTATEAITDLKRRGFNHDFNISDGCLYCKNEAFEPKDFVIDEIHRFEGATDPADQMILYAITSLTHKLKGILINAYGMYADTDTNKLINKLSLDRN